MNNLLSHNTEVLLQKAIFPDLENGRQDYDLAHTKAVVHWAKKICSSEPTLNHRVLVTSAYAHDWGYCDVFQKMPSMSDIHDKKTLHMEVGAKRIKALLNQNMFDEYSQEEIDRISHLVSVHDNLGVLHAGDEIALMEADTFGSLDTDLITPTFSLADNNKYIQEQVLGLRFPLFQHKFSVEMMPILLSRRVSYYDSLTNENGDVKT